MAIRQCGAVGDSGNLGRCREHTIDGACRRVTYCPRGPADDCHAEGGLARVSQATLVYGTTKFKVPGVHGWSPAAQISLDTHEAGQLVVRLDGSGIYLASTTAAAFSPARPGPSAAFATSAMSSTTSLRKARWLNAR